MGRLAEKVYIDLTVRGKDMVVMSHTYPGQII